MMNLRIKIARGYLTVTGIHSPKRRERNSTEFYKILQRHIDTINKKYYLVVGGGFSA
jgi:hypothetical protein